MLRRAASLESARNTRMQGVPSQRPIAVPTTPGSARSESPCAARPSWMVFVVTASLPSGLLRPAQPASNPATRTVAVARLPPPHRYRGPVTAAVRVVVGARVVGPFRHRHAGHPEAHGLGCPPERREEDDAGPVP